jgi:hypothetical protein
MVQEGRFPFIFFRNVKKGEYDEYNADQQCRLSQSDDCAGCTVYGIQLDSLDQTLECAGRE